MPSPYPFLKSTLIITLLGAAAACSNNPHNQKTPIADTIHAGLVTSASSNSANNALRAVYITRHSLEIPKYHIDVRAVYELPSSPVKDSGQYFQRTCVYVTNKETSHIDSADLDCDASSISINDLTDSLAIKPLLLRLSWSGDDDITENYFVGFDKGQLAVLFNVPALESIRRKSQWELTGFTWDQDELVHAREHDYPFTVSLKTWKTRVSLPATQLIGFETETLSAIKVYTERNLTPSSKLNLPKGAKVTVDTIFRSLNVVKLITNDSTAVYARPGELAGRLREDVAG